MTLPPETDTGKRNGNGHNGYELTNVAPKVWRIDDDGSSFLDPAEFDPDFQASLIPHGHSTIEPITPSSWCPVDMAVAMSAGEILPDLGRRTDGELLLYKSKVHWFFGNFESGKTWAALHFVAQVLQDGGTALYIDFEDDARGIGWRLYQLGVPIVVVQDSSRFAYIRPEESLTTQAALAGFEATLSLPFDIAVIDGVTESISIEGLKDSVGGDIAAWLKLLPKRVARQTGAATICIDHIPKAQDNRGMPIGSQHKMSGMDGVAYKFISEVKLGKTKAGWSYMRVIKDRPGGVRGPLGVDYDPSDQSELIGQYCLDATDAKAYRSSVTPPVISTTVVANTKPDKHWCMEHASAYLASHLDDAQRTQSKVIEHLQATVKAADGRPIGKDCWKPALKELCEKNYAYVESGPKNSKLYYHCALFDATKPSSPEDIARRAARIRKLKAKRELEAVASEAGEKNA
ncbi:AAA family ATPase [Mycobacterium sp. ML4]